MAETKKRLDERTIGRIPVAQYFASSSAGSDTYVITLTPAPTAYETGREYIFKADVANTGAASLNVNGLGAKTIKKNVSTDLADGDIAIGSIITCIYDGTNMQAIAGLTNLPSTSYFGGTGADGAVDGSANITLTGSNNTYIEKNYTSFAAASGGGKTLTVTPTNCVVHIKISGNADFTNWTISLNSKGGPGGAGGTGGAGPSGGGAGTPGKSYATNTGTAAGGVQGQYSASVTTLSSAGGIAGEASGYVSLAEAISANKVILLAPGGGGSGGGGGYSPSDNATGGAGGAGGGCIFIEVAGNVTFSGTTITATGASGSSGGSSTSTLNSGAGGGGGGGGGSVVILYNGSLTGSVTPTLTGGSAGAGGGSGAGMGGQTFCGGGGGASGGSSAGKGTTGNTAFTGAGAAGSAGTAGYYLIAQNTFII